MNVNKAELIEQVRANVPEQLRLLRVWLLHDPDKTPIYANGENRSGEMDTPEDRQKFVTFETAADAFTRVERASGLGVALGEVPGEEIRLCGIDLDDCYVGEQLDDRVLQILGAAASYTEKSPSGAGFHILGIGDIGTHKSAGLEIYSGARYFTVTGAHVNGAHLADVTDAATFAKKLLLDSTLQSSVGNPRQQNQSDNDVIAALKRAGLYLRAGTNGKHLIRCRWEIRHTPNEDGNRQTSSTEAAYFELGAVVRDEQLKCGMFKCMHNHCADRGLKQLREFLGLERKNDQAPGSARETPFVLLPVRELLTPGKPPEFVVDQLFEVGAVIGIVGPPESAKSLLMQNAIACISTGTPFHGRRVKRGLVVYLVGEGQHGLRARFQALESRYQLGLAAAPLLVAKTATSFLDATEVARVNDAITAAQDRHGLPLLMIVVDTLARFISPGDESKAQDMGTYLNAIDFLRGDAIAVTLHHPGHGDMPRARGSSSWRAGIDAEFWLENVQNVVTVTCQKMKDGEKPAPFSFRIETETTRMAREDGSPVHSVVLAPTDLRPVRSKPTGKNQKLLLAELEQRAGSDALEIWTEGELREIARTVGMHRNSARDAVLGLRQLGYLIATIGGSRLQYSPEGPKDRKRTESAVSCAGIDDRKDPVSLETGLSVMPFGHSGRS